LRDVDITRRNQYEQDIRTMIKEAAFDYHLTVEIQEDTNLEPVDCAEWIQSIIEEESKTMGLECPKMMSGPFHDAMVMASACDIGMIFVRCKDGISHNPAEFASYDDLAIGTELLYKTALQVSSKIGQSLSQLSSSK
jgi:allantoate deiminase